VLRKIKMNAISAISLLPGIFRQIERGNFLPTHSYHVRGRKGKVLGIGGESLCYPLMSSHNAEVLKRLLVDVEDKRFYQHGAIDFKAILRAVVKNCFAKKITQGGSTITQQLARSLFLSPSRTWTRKLTETFIAFKLERHLTKDQILDAYCDFVYTGRGSRGFEAASRMIFRKPFRSLSPDRIPALIGLLGAPEKFHPGNNEQRFWARAEQKGRGLNILVDKSPLNPMCLPRMMGQRIAKIAFGELERLALPISGVKGMELTIDEFLQPSIDEVLKEFSCDQRVAQLAAIVICNKTGDILAESAWTKGRQSQFSPSFFGRIQPGSTFKTFALLAAIESGLSPDEVFESAPYNSQEKTGSEWVVRNYANKYSKHLSLEEALVKSDNSVFARLADYLDRKSLASTYERFSLVDPQLFTKSTVLGGVAKGVSLLQIANAYSAIARNGVMIEPRLLRSINYQDNTSIYVHSDCGRVVAEYSAVQKIKQSLELCGLRAFAQSISGKTGTTKKSSLFSGYNDDVSIALWLDFDHEQQENDPKALTAMQVVKKIGHKLLAWSENRTFSIV
jgi:penicillin-binding protein 1A